MSWPLKCCSFHDFKINRITLFGHIGEEVPIYHYDLSPKVPNEESHFSLQSSWMCSKPVS